MTWKSHGGAVIKMMMLSHLLLLLVVGASASAATLYASPTGSGTACSQSAPCTISGADTKAAAGDTIHVAPGTYSGLTTTKNGTSSARITFISDTRWGAKLNTSNGGDTIWWSKGNYVDIVGFEIDGTGTSVAVNGGIFMSGTGSSAKNNHVHHISRAGCQANGASGIGTSDYYGPAGGLIIDSNYIHDIGLASCGASGSWLWHGIYVGSPDAVITNNVVVDVDAGFAAHVWHNGRRNKFANNTFVSNAGCFLFGGGDYYNGMGASGSGGNTAANNICSGAGTAFNQSGDNQVANTYTNNLEFGNTNRVTGTMQASYIQNAVLGDPKFVSDTDRHLQPLSPAIGAANATYAPPADYDGVTRTSPDIGAYEYVAGPPAGITCTFSMPAVTVTATAGAGSSVTGTLSCN